MSARRQPTGSRNSAPALMTPKSAAPSRRAEHGRSGTTRADAALIEAAIARFPVVETVMMRRNVYKEMDEKASCTLWRCNKPIPTPSCGRMCATSSRSTLAASLIDAAQSCSADLRRAGLPG